MKTKVETSRTVGKILYSLFKVVIVFTSSATCHSVITKPVTCNTIIKHISKVSHYNYLPKLELRKNKLTVFKSSLNIQWILLIVLTTKELIQQLMPVLLYDRIFACTKCPYADSEFVKKNIVFFSIRSK